MKTNLPLIVFASALTLLLAATSSCLKDNCEDRVSTEFRDGQDQWIPYSNGPEMTVFKKEGEEVFDTLILDNYEFDTFTVQNTDNCNKEQTHEKHRAELHLQSSPGTTAISLFQSSEDVGLFSIAHDERELFFFYREKRFQIEIDLYQYFSTYTLDGRTYTDVLEITCNEETEPCPNYKQLIYQRGGGLIGYTLNDANWFVQ